MEWCQPLFLQLLQVAEGLNADRRFRCRVWSHSVAEKLPLDGYALGIECRHRRRRKPSRLRLHWLEARRGLYPEPPVLAMPFSNPQVVWDEIQAILTPS